MISPQERHAALVMLESLSYTQQAEGLKGIDTDNWLEAGAVVCIMRYGVFEAGKILVKAGINAAYACHLVSLARDNTNSLDFTS